MKNKAESNKPWGGRFTEATASSAETFSASIHFDMRLYRHDIAGSKAHAKMLAKVGLINGSELEQILVGLTEIEAEIESNTFVFPWLKKWARQVRNSIQPGAGMTRWRLICGFTCERKASMSSDFFQTCRRDS
jgi:hypothetical protein